MKESRRRIVAIKEYPMARAVGKISAWAMDSFKKKEVNAMPIKKRIRNADTYRWSLQIIKSIAGNRAGQEGRGSGLDGSEGRERQHQGSCKKAGFIYRGKGKKGDKGTVTPRTQNKYRKITGGNNAQNRGRATHITTKIWTRGILCK